MKINTDDFVAFIIVIVSFCLLCGFTFMGGRPPSAVEAGCLVGATFTYNGDHSSSTDHACDSAGAGIDGTQNGTPVVSADYVELDAAADEVVWVIDASEANYDEGCICFDVYIVGDGDIGENAILEIVYDTNNAIYIFSNDSLNQIQAKHETAGVVQDVVTSALAADEWETICYTWKTGADGGGEHAISEDRGSSWVDDDTEDLDDWGNDATSLTIGSTNEGKAQQETTRVRDICVTGTYKDACSF